MKKLNSYKFEITLEIILGVFSEQKEYTLFYIGASTGQVYKVSQWNLNGKLKSQLLDIFQVLLLLLLL